MADHEPVRVFIACRGRERLAALFAQHAGELLPAESAEAAEVVVADEPLDNAQRLAAHLAQPRPLAVVGLGSAARGDVNLPLDAPLREIAMACRLLGEVVRLRRRLEHSEQRHDEAAELARTDPLTGLPNRRAWDEKLERLWPADGPPVDCCLAIVDLDHFKQINDEHGHAVGDALLRSAGHGLRAALRDQDFVARLGGDEFGVLLFRLDERDAQVVLERVRQRLASSAVGASLPPCTASIGYCLSEQLEEPSPAIIGDQADKALRKAKQGGRNRVEAFRLE